MTAAARRPAATLIERRRLLEERFAPHAENEAMVRLLKLMVSGTAPPPSKRPPAAAPVAPAPAPAAHGGVQRVIKNIEHLFTLPDHVLRIMNMLRSPRVSTEAIVQEIKKDPVLAAETLKVINSGFYGFQNRISSIQHAVVIMGMQVVQAIVLSVSVVDFVSLKQLWRHSLLCAHACQLLARKTDLSRRDDLSVAGLLHDIGKAIMAEYLPDDYQAVVDSARDGRTAYYLAERVCMGVTHAEVAQWLLARWNLAPETVEAIGGHHYIQPDAPLAQRAAVVHIADVLANALGVHSGEDAVLPALDPAALDILNLDMNRLGDVIEDLCEYVEQTAPAD